MKIKDWKKFQHFNNRKPPWIKLYRDILDDVEWFDLEPTASKHLVMLWLIASEDMGNLPDIKTIAFRLRASEHQVKQSLSKLSHWILQDDINMISKRYQNDALEREGERETEEEKEKEKEGKKRARAFGSFENVKLTEEEHAALVEKLNGSSGQYIESLSCYLAQHPRKKYGSHFATILNWHRKDMAEQNKKHAQAQEAEKWLKGEA